jgi:DNA-binding transcriptional ArsR family regulator
VGVRRETEVEATPQEVWEAIATEEGRARWLDEPGREVVVESAEAPHRLVWWWWEGDGPATRVEFLVVAAPAGARVVAGGPPGPAGGRVRAGARVTDRLGAVLGALADPTRRGMVETLLRDGVTSVPALSGELPISRQAVAKHLAALGEAGLVERVPGTGREVRYRLRPGALDETAAWIGATASAWDARLDRLRRAVEH